MLKVGPQIGEETLIQKNMQNNIEVLGSMYHIRHFICYDMRILCISYKDAGTNGPYIFSHKNISCVCLLGQVWSNLQSSTDNVE